MLPPPSEDNRYRDLEARIRKLESALRSAFTTISGGAGIRIVDGGRLALVSAAGVVMFDLGPVGPSLPDGSPQPGWTVTRADNSIVLQMRDAFPAPDGTLQQALNWFDRNGNVVLADDTNSGQGLARPWLNGGFARSRYADMSVQTTSGSFETLWETRISKQQPRLEVVYRATMDTAGTTGETKVLVNGTQLGATQSEGFIVSTRFVGPAAVAGDHMEDLVVEIQGRRTSAAGALRVEALYWRSRQS